MYIDTSASTRICLNAENADSAAQANKLTTARTIGISGAVTGSATFDGSANISINTSVNHTHNYAGSASAGGDADRAIKVKDSADGKDITITYGKDPYSSVSYLAGWDHHELGNISPASITVGKATTLATARTISVGDGVTSTAASFDGSANISIPVTGVKEKYLTWGGRNIAGDIAPIDAAMSYLHSANRAQFIPAEAITIQYSNNSGSTWLDYGALAEQKQQIFSSPDGGACFVGKHTTTATTTLQDQLRIIINADDANIYTTLKTILICWTTGGGENTITIEKAYRNTPTNFTTVIKDYPIRGGSGWNSYTYNDTFGGYPGQNQPIILRLTFKVTKIPTWGTCGVYNILMLGVNAWKTPSKMANSGHLYSWDMNQNAFFPGQITATKFRGNATSADSAAKLTTARTIGLTGDVTATGVSFDGSANINLPTSINVNYAGSSSKGGAATAVATSGPGTANVSRHVWFSDSNDETKRSYDDNFKYNPSTKILTTSITGSSASCTGNAATATKLATARKIGDASFDGTANIALSTIGAQPIGNYFKGTKDSENYWGLNTPDGSTSSYIRTSSSGLIPYQLGSIGNGHSNLGTKDWYFNSSYVDNTHTKVINLNDGSANITYDTANQCITFNFS